MARAEGFEPPNAGTKTQCLTTWRRPIEQLDFTVSQGVRQLGELALAEAANSTTEASTCKVTATITY